LNAPDWKADNYLKVSIAAVFLIIGTLRTSVRYIQISDTQVTHTSA